MFQHIFEIAHGLFKSTIPSLLLASLVISRTNWRQLDHSILYLFKVHWSTDCSYRECESLSASQTIVMVYKLIDDLLFHLHPLPQTHFNKGVSRIRYFGFSATKLPLWKLFSTLKTSVSVHMLDSAYYKTILCLHPPKTSLLQLECLTTECAPDNWLLALPLGVVGILLSMRT